MNPVRFFGRSLFPALLIVFWLAGAALAQISTTGRLTGTVTDSTGAVVPRAQITAQNDNTKARFTAVANKDGEWTLPSIDNGTYTVTITVTGFKATVVQGVKVDVGQGATVNASLEVGNIGEQVVVTGGGEVLQTSSTSVSSTITGKQIHELPFSTRDAMQLVLAMPGVQTPGTSRTSSVNGLTKSALNISLDGASIQDNFLKSSDGFFTTTQPKSDAVEEVTISTATPGAESGGSGAVQIKFVTKQGSSEFHGGLFWQHRNNALNANYFFNNIDGLPRDRIILNQYGGSIGGPILIPKLLKRRDKAFFFVNMEEFRLPQTYNAARTVLLDTARQGVYRYKDSTGNIQNINLYDIASQQNVKNAALPTGQPARAYPTTVDPIIAKALGLVNDASLKGVLRSRIDTNGDYNRQDLSFQDPGNNLRRFPTIRIDVNATEKHHMEFIHNFQHYFSLPDGVNGTIAAYPGTGGIIGSSTDRGSIYRNAFTFVLAERWTIKSNLINEIRATSSGNGTSIFNRDFGPSPFSLFGGNAIGQATAYVSGFQTYSSTSRRNTPVKGLTDNLTWVKSSHEINFGLSYTRVASFTQGVGSAVVPAVTLGIATGDPVNTGTTSIFTTTYFPNSTATQRGEAANLYALLTGRISSTTRTAAFDENARTFKFAPTNERNHLTEYGLYTQDRWRIFPSLTLNYGVRWEFDPSPLNDNQVYTRNGVEGLFGVSGVGNYFKPGVYNNPIIAQYRQLKPGEKAYNNSYKDFAPSFGFAWSPDWKNGVMKRAFGGAGQTVLRGGYSIAYIREGFSPFNSIFGANQGISYATGTSAANFPTEFGQAGSRSLRDATLPFLTLPEAKFPLTALQGNSVNDFNPNLKPGYVQSWTFGIQRELSKDMALEIRYVGNHATRLWRQYEIGEVNIFENGFLNEFKAAQNNLAIFTAANRNCGQTGQVACNFGNTGLAGQVAIPIIATAIGSTTDTTTLTSLGRGEAGRVAAAIAQNLTRMNNLITNPLTRDIVKPITLPDPNNPASSITLSNFFVANPRSPTSSFLMDNAADSNYHSLQVELRRRLSKGLLVQGNYTFSKALGNSFSNNAAGTLTPTTLRNFDYDKSVSPRDNRHAFKVDYIYEMPFGPGKNFLNGNNRFLSRLVGGWQVGGVARIQSGTPSLLTGGRLTFNNRESGVLLFNMTARELQDNVKIRKETVCTAGKCQGIVYWLPQAIIDNSLAAFETGGKTLADLDRSKPYIGPPTTPGQLGARIFLYGPWTSRYDINVLKQVKITEKTNFELRVQFLNAFNQSSIVIRDLANNADSFGVNSSTFGQTRNAFRDFTVSGTNDPGGRLIEFQLRLNF